MARNELERDIRYASYARHREAALARILAEKCPADLVMFYVRFVGPLRDGDLIEARECHDKTVYSRVMDMQRRAIVALTDWRRQSPVSAPQDLIIRPFVSGCSVQLVDERTGFVRDHWVTIPNDWRQPWTLRCNDD